VDKTSGSGGLGQLSCDREPGFSVQWGEAPGVGSGPSSSLTDKAHSDPRQDSATVDGWCWLAVTGACRGRGRGRGSVQRSIPPWRGALGEASSASSAGVSWEGITVFLMRVRTEVLSGEESALLASLGVLVPAGPRATKHPSVGQGGVLSPMCYSRHALLGCFCGKSSQRVSFWKQCMSRLWMGGWLNGGWRDEWGGGWREVWRDR
jgi:hypothetical protein